MANWKEKLSLLYVPFAVVAAWIIFLFVSILYIVMLYLGTRISLEWSQRWPLVVYLAVLGFWTLVIVLWVRMISGEFGRSLFRESYVNGILQPPLLYSFSLLAIAAHVFASISVTLQRFGHVTFKPPLPNDLAPVVDFYVWHFLDSVPGLDIPQTLHWVNPYEYSDALSGKILLIFKLLVILPVISSFKKWHDVRGAAVIQKKRASLTIGMSPEAVEHLLGKPIAVQPSGPVDVPPQPNTSVWTYGEEKSKPDWSVRFDAPVASADANAKLIDWTGRKV